MTDREERFLKLALKYKQEYNNSPWWKFKKRHELYSRWQSALELMMRYTK